MVLKFVSQNIRHRLLPVNFRVRPHSNPYGISSRQNRTEAGFPRRTPAKPRTHLSLVSGTTGPYEVTGLIVPLAHSHN